MTVSKAIERTQGHGAGLLQRGAVRYAQSLLEPEEIPAAAAIASISAAVSVGGAVRRERFPGVAVLTDRRAIAVCALPGIRRAVIVRRGTCVETPSAIRYQAAFSDENSSFSLSLNLVDGERFSRCVAVLEGREEAFDAVDKAPADGILNPVLVRTRLRVRRAKEVERRERAERLRRQASAAGEDADRSEKGSGSGLSGVSGGYEDAQAVSHRLAKELEEARKRGPVSDTDPKAVAARLAAELAVEEEKRENDQTISNP